LLEGFAIELNAEAWTVGQGDHTTLHYGLSSQQLPPQGRFTALHDSAQPMYATADPIALPDGSLHQAVLRLDGG